MIAAAASGTLVMEMVAPAALPPAMPGYVRQLEIIRHARTLAHVLREGGGPQARESRYRALLHG